VQVRDQVRAHHLDSALAVIDQRLTESPTDLEARGWRGRLLAWKGKWAEAETEYRFVLERAPNDTEILCGLADVLLWQGRAREALPLVEQARSRQPADPEILLRRARVLRDLGDVAGSRAQLRELLLSDPSNAAARQALATTESPARHELRIGTDIDTFSYTDTAQTQTIALSSRWSERWSSEFALSTYQRFGEQATKLSAGATVRFAKANWIGIGGSGAHDNYVIPKREAGLEYGHGFRFRVGVLRGLEASYQQRWLWYQNAHVLTVSGAQTWYFPKDWNLRIVATGARSGFTSTGIEWVPSGSTRLSFPVHGQLGANLAFAVGTENFAEADQIGRFSARTYAGGLRYRFTPKQDLTSYIAHQDRSQGRSQVSYGLSYGFRF
jgi:YaiO family outer membrane protein